MVENSKRTSDNSRKNESSKKSILSRAFGHVHRTRCTFKIVTLFGIIAGLFVAPSLIAGQKEEILSIGEESSGFKGILDLTGLKDEANGSNKNVRILLVHGMGRHCIGWADDFINTITKEISNTKVEDLSSHYDSIDSILSSEEVVAYRNEEKITVNDSNYQTDCKVDYDNPEERYDSDIITRIWNATKSMTVKWFMKEVKPDLFADDYFENADMAEGLLLTRQEVLCRHIANKVRADELTSVNSGNSSLDPSPEIFIKQTCYQFFDGGGVVAGGTPDFASGKETASFLRVKEASLGGLSPDSRRKVIFYELTWDPLTRIMKRSLLREYQSRFTHDRQLVNDMVKRMLLSDAMADPVMVIGENKWDFRAQVLQALCILVSDEKNIPQFPCDTNRASRVVPPIALEEAEASEFQQVSETLAEEPNLKFLEENEIFTITHSLGSYIAYDTYLLLPQLYFEAVEQRVRLGSTRTIIEKQSLDRIREEYVEVITKIARLDKEKYSLLAAEGVADLQQKLAEINRKIAEHEFVLETLDSRKRFIDLAAQKRTVERYRNDGAECIDKLSNLNSDEISYYQKKLLNPAFNTNITHLEVTQSPKDFLEPGGVDDQEKLLDLSRSDSLLDIQKDFNKLERIIHIENMLFRAMYGAKSIYMFANQVPLLELGRVETNEDNKRTPRNLKNYLLDSVRCIAAIRAADRKNLYELYSSDNQLPSSDTKSNRKIVESQIQIRNSVDKSVTGINEDLEKERRLYNNPDTIQLIGFTDVDDPLSYVSSENLHGIIPAVVSNKALTFPFFGLPTDLHGNYFQNETIIEAIVYGCQRDFVDENKSCIADSADKTER